MKYYTKTLYIGEHKELQKLTIQNQTKFPLELSAQLTHPMRLNWMNAICVSLTGLVAITELLYLSNVFLVNLFPHFLFINHAPDLTKGIT